MILGQHGYKYTHNHVAEEKKRLEKERLRDLGQATVRFTLMRFLFTV